MITVYAARSVAEAMIARVNAVHCGIRGVTPCGAAFRADDPDLLTWVQATASFGFLEAYARYVQALDGADRDRYYAEGAAAAVLYGATGAPGEETALSETFNEWISRLEPSAVVGEFLSVIERADALPAPVRPLQGLLVKAAVEVVPSAIRERIGLGRGFGLAVGEAALVRFAARRADRMALPNAPPALACRRLGLPADFLYR